jgi:HlyD family secretion protein
MKKVIIFGLIIIVVATAVFLYTSDALATKDDGPKTVEIGKGSIVDKALAVGQIEPRREIAVKSKIAGIVRTVFVEVGDLVKAGDPLFDIKPDPTPVEYANAKREVELYQVTFDKVKREYDRSSQLKDKNLISTEAFESAQADYDDAKVRLKLAGEKLALIESGSIEFADRIVDNIIKSPITGSVLSIPIEEGDPVVPLTSYQAGTEMMTLAQMEDLIFKGTVDEIDVGKVKEGMPVEIEIGALPNEKVNGTLTKISPKARKSDGATMFDVEIDIDQMGKKLLRAGYSANADVIINKREDIILVPERLVTITDSVRTVEIKDSLGAIISRDIETGLSDGINIEVLAGLQVGDLVIERPPREIKPWD